MTSMGRCMKKRLLGRSVGKVCVIRDSLSIYMSEVLPASSSPTSTSLAFLYCRPIRTCTRVLFSVSNEDNKYDQDSPHYTEFTLYWIALLL